MGLIFEHYKQWRRWNKHNAGNFVHKLLVLFKLRTDLTFEWVLTPEEGKEIRKHNEEKV